MPDTAMFQMKRQLPSVSTGAVILDTPWFCICIMLINRWIPAVIFKTYDE